MIIIIICEMVICMLGPRSAPLGCCVCVCDMRLAPVTYLCSWGSLLGGGGAGGGV